MIWMLITGNETERHRLIGCLFKLSAGKNTPVEYPKKSKESNKAGSYGFEPLAV